MKLIIAEKPSLARNIADAIGNMKKNGNYMEGNGYYVTWAFGHLFSLCDIEYYNGVQLQPNQQARWTLENLPCFPKTFNFELKKDGKSGKVDYGVERQFKTIEFLCNKDDVDGIINAGDADREGEIIVRLCIQNALKSEKDIYRLWLPDQTAQTINKALGEMKLDSEYNSLADEGFARTYIDWLYGVNLTRLATLKTGTLLRVGRVIAPIVRAIYDRDMQIRNFVPEKYYALVSRCMTNGETVELISKEKFDKDKFAEAKALCKKYNEAGATVTKVVKKEQKLFAGKLYSLSTLQNFLSKKYKMSMKESLDIIQNLYEKGFLTYPRTNSEYLATAEKDKIKSILANCQKIGYPVVFKDSKSIFDDSKIESHSALTPTYKIPNKTQLTEKEMQVYSTVFRRFVAVFCKEDCNVLKSEITIEINGKLETFVLKGMIMVDKGWTKYDDYTQKDKTLPNLKEGDAVNLDFQPTEKETTPPKHYTVETLNNYLKNPFREEKKLAEESDDDTDDMEEYRAMLDGLELGTEATRTGIIDNAKNTHYIDLKKDTYYILPGGEFFIRSLDDMQISMDKHKTSEMGQALKKVFKGKMTVSESVELAEKEIAEIFSLAKGAGMTTDYATGFFGDIVGKCPICGRNLLRGRYAYGCEGFSDENNPCKFSVSTNICSKVISISLLNEILTNGKSPLLKGFISPKTKREFDAFLVLDKAQKKVVFEFPPRTPIAPSYPTESPAENAPEPIPPPEDD